MKIGNIKWVVKNLERHLPHGGDSNVTMLSKRQKKRTHEESPTEMREELTPISPDDRIVDQKVDISGREQ